MGFTVLIFTSWALQSCTWLNTEILKYELFCVCIHTHTHTHTHTHNHVIYTHMYTYIHIWAFPGSSVGKESLCNVGDPSWIPGLGRFSGEGIGYPPQYSWASLVAQLVKNLPAMQETWLQSIQSVGSKESDMTEWLILCMYVCIYIYIYIYLFIYLYTALTYSFSHLEPVCCSMSNSNCCFLTCI